MNKNVERPEEYQQVCVWPGTLVGAENVQAFVKFMDDDFGTRVLYLEEIETLPDEENGEPVPDTGGRNDLFFAVHNDDVGRFAVQRLMAGIRWIEDVLSEINYHSPIYPERVFGYKSWDASQFPVASSDCVPGTNIPKPMCKLVGEDGNCYSVLGLVSTVLRRAGCSEETVDAYRSQACSGDYNTLLAVSMDYVGAY